MAIKVDVFKTQADGWTLMEVNYPLLQAITNEEFSEAVKKEINDQFNRRFHLEVYNNEYYQKVARFTAVQSGVGVAIILTYTKKLDVDGGEEKIEHRIIDLNDVRTITSMLNNQFGVFKDSQCANE
ncbi:hypothetical protein POF51_26535 [Brevibacillus sp. AG]|uniref:hypothetical protein n=1 Tax=Brevibacillus sp. AG TaxID=3020891 RepID=UPI00232D6E2C|nr:hypothetical protein [Brevibacillus sp. AG]MDC0764282.1 hypothetical protein [Brevibacillus sp. AG]